MSEVVDLGLLAALAREAGSSWIAAQTDALAERLREGRFYVVCVGQFKRGKSTLLNALTDTTVRPTGGVPITAAVTVVRYGDRLAARVRFADRDWRSAIRPRSRRTLPRSTTLVRPIEESAARVALLRVAVADAERSLLDLGHLLSAEQERLAKRFSEERDRFVTHTLPAAQQELREAIRGEPAGGRGLQARALEHARAVMQRWVDRWREEQEPKATAIYREAEVRFVGMANTFLDRLASSPGLEGLARLRIHQGFRARSLFYYADLMHVASGSAATWMRDLLLPWQQMRTSERAAGHYLERLLHVNSARMKNDFAERVVQSRRLLEGEIRERLRNLAASAEQALENARQAHSAGAAAIRTKLEWLDGLRRRVETLEGLTPSTAAGARQDARSQDAGSLFA